MFRDLAQPLLFREFDDDCLDGYLTKTISFAKIIYRRPDLGQHVRSISILPGAFGPASPGRLAKEDCDLFKAAIRDLELGDQEITWITAMENSDLSVFAALLANKTPNLQQLNLPGGQLFMKPFTHLFTRNASFLSSLGFLWVECDDEFSGYTIAAYQELVTLPKLANVTFEYGDLVDSSFPSSWAPGTLSAKDFAFHHCHVDGGAIHKLMQACKCLESFTYQNFSLDPHDRRILMPGTAAEFNAQQALEAALQHKETLKHFHVEFARDPWEIENLEEYLSTRVKVGSFRDFSVLESIYIPHAVLPPHPQFPRSLKVLNITDCNSSIHNMVQKIAKDCKNGLYPEFTLFKVLAVDITSPIKLPGQRIPQGKIPEQCFLGLRDLFKNTKVDFQILPYKMPDFDDYGYGDSDLEDEGAYEYQLGEGPLPGMPPGMGGGGLLDLLLQRAMQDPDFAHLAPNAANDDSWETDDDE